MQGNMNAIGKVDISEEVIAYIAGSTAVDCYGLAGMVPRGLKEGLGDFIGKEHAGKGVNVKLDGGRVTVDLHIIVTYGVRISEVCNNMMARVRQAVEKMTGLEVTAVNINVEGVKI